MQLCHDAGFEPEVVREVGPAAWETTVRDRGAVGLTTPSAPQAHVADLRALQLRPPTTFPLDLLHRAGDDRRAITALRRLATTFADRSGHQPEQQRQ